MIINPKIVTKPWGYEEWLSDGQRMPYALKRILFKAGHRSSLQVHRYKKETNHVIGGEGILLLGKNPFPISDYLNGLLDGESFQWYIDDLIAHRIEPGMSFDVNPGTIHRVIAITDLEFVEASTPELDDVVRLQDDTNRRNGRIDSEHA